MMPNYAKKRSVPGSERAQKTRLVVRTGRNKKEQNSNTWMAQYMVAVQDASGGHRDVISPPSDPFSGFVLPASLKRTSIDHNKLTQHAETFVRKLVTGG